MTLSRTIKSIATWWGQRCREKRLERAYPGKKREFMTAALKGEVRS